MSAFRSEVERAVLAALDDLYGIKVEFEIETPSPEIADFAVPCFPLAKALSRSPGDIARQLVDAIGDLSTMSRVWNEGGYLNFHIDEEMLVKAALGEILATKERYGSGEAKDLRILLEHTSVNPTGPIHVGRARNPLIGDTLARCLRRCGYPVTTEYYVNDVGKQVVLLTWGLENIPPDQVESTDNGKEDHRLVGFYQRANMLLEEEPRVGEQVAEMLRLFEKGDEEVIARVRRTANRMLDGILESLGRVGVRIDRLVWESQFILDGSARKVVERLRRSPCAREEGGAFFLDLEEFGIHGRDTKFFFTRGDGTTLYTTRDMAYHLDKFSRADHLINVLGEDQKLGMAHLEAALSLLGESRKPENVFYSFVSLPEGRMSTRKGRTINLDDLIAEAEERALEEVRKRREDLTEERMMEIARFIGRGAIRFNIVRVQAEKPMVFRWEEALNFEGNSAPFVQYAHARACSILRKAGKYEIVVDPHQLADGYERRLIHSLARFPGVVTEAGEKRRIHLLPSYGQEVASAFNQFYAYVPVLRAGKRRDARLSLVEASMWVLKNVLDTLGIVAPEEM